MRALSTLVSATFLSAVLSIATPAHAQSQLVSAKDPMAIKQIIEAKGWTAKLHTPADDAPYLEGERDGTKFAVLFMTCDDNHRNCSTLQYYVGFSDAKDTSLSKINEWNKTKRFARAYIDNDGDPVLEMDLDLDFSGIPSQNIDESLNTWDQLMSAYHDYLYDS